MMAFEMGLMHCPLCIGLALLSALRFSGHAWLLWRRFGPDQPRRDSSLALA